MAGDYLYLIQGDSYTFTCNVAVDGVAQNIYGASLWFLAKVDPDNDNDSDAIINCSTASGQIAISGNNNSTVTISINSATTNNYTEASRLYWALRAETSTGNVYTLDQGLAAVVRPVVVTR